MFTGIVEEKGFIKALSTQQITLSAKIALVNTKIGDSIAANGVCLTVCAIDNHTFTAQVMPETLRRSNLASLRIGDAVNLERAALVGSRIGGHNVQGHIDEVGIVKRLAPDGNAVIMEISATQRFMKYVVSKCFVAVDGVSLTEIAHTADTISVSLVGTTRDQTRLGLLEIGDSVNLEADIVAKYAQKYTANNTQSKITEQFLIENGF